MSEIISKDIYEYLIAQGVATSANLFRDFMPEVSPAMCVSTYGGPVPERDADGNFISYPQIQIRVQYPGSDSDLAWTWMARAQTALAAIVNNVLGGSLYQGVKPGQSAPVPLGVDQAGNFRLSQNYNIIRSE